MTYTCKHCGEQVPALTICNCRGALIEHYLEELDWHGWTGLKELTAEIKALNSNLRVALRKNDSLQVQLAEYRDTVTHWQAKNERLRAEWERYFGFTFDESGFIELYAMVMGYDERKEIGDPIFTVEQFEQLAAENERLTAEVERLKEIVSSMCIELKKDNSIQQRRAASRKYRQMIEQQEQPQ